MCQPGPEPEPSWADGPAGDDSPGLPGAHYQAMLQASPRRGRRGLVAFTALLAAGLAGLATCAVGISHQLLPRQFTAAQRRQISAWESERQWRALPAGKIFPESVTYVLPGSALYATGGLTLQARLLGISPQTTCASAVSGTAVRILSQHGCAAALRATYVDSSGSLVATVAVAVMPGNAAAGAVIDDLTGSGRISPTLVQALGVARTPAAGFGAAQRQLTRAVGAGPYVVLTTAGFSDGRRRLRVPADPYLEQEMATLAIDLARSAGSVLGAQPPAPACPGAPGC